MAWGTLAAIIFAIIFLAIALGLWTYYGGYLSEAAVAGKNELLKAWKS